MLSNIKIWAAFLILFIIAAAYWYYSDSQARIATLLADNAKMQTAIELQTQAIESMQKDAKLQAQILIRTYDEFTDARQMVQSLQEKLARHELGALAASKPKLVENLINRGTLNANRCIEILSGSALTDEEINATKPSEINVECPSVANPNYKENNK